MVEAVSQADIAYQYEMWIGRGETPVWTQILGLEDLPFPDQVPEDIDVTHMQSPGRTRETMPGLLPVADSSLDKQYWPTDDGDVLLEELSGLTAAGTSEVVLIEFNTGGATPAARRTYQGYVNSFNPTGTVGDKRMVSVALKIMARQATNDRVIS
ncbi:hypothetical protein ACRARG_12570 [Pseudooceanicola sp. C21-150M6]|uniref:hypothetical protein n=1 Tax=Pseudooceanicola sp. C21-150M6 TaxID=3434355 RepID=UPI003D7F94D7